MTENERYIAFMCGLEKLTRETGVIISGCGCCDSPQLYVASEKELHEEAGYFFDHPAAGSEVTWASPNMPFETWDYKKGKIVSKANAHTPE